MDEGELTFDRFRVPIEVRNYSDRPISDATAGVLIRGTGNVLSGRGSDGGRYDTVPIAKVVLPHRSGWIARIGTIPEGSTTTPSTVVTEVRTWTGSSWAEPEFEAFVEFTDFDGRRWRRTSEYKLEHVRPGSHETADYCLLG